MIVQKQIRMWYLEKKTDIAEEYLDIDINLQTTLYPGKGIVNNKIICIFIF